MNVNVTASNVTNSMDRDGEGSISPSQNKSINSQMEEDGSSMGVSTSEELSQPSSLVYSSTVSS
eukprot:3947302-Ditylum_brightwellii.AAC.1